MLVWHVMKSFSSSFYGSKWKIMSLQLAILQYSEICQKYFLSSLKAINKNSIWMWEGRWKKFGFYYGKVFLLLKGSQKFVFIACVVSDLAFCKAVTI